MNAPNHSRQLQRTQQSHKPRRSIDEREQNYVYLKAMYTASARNQAEFEAGERKAKLEAGV